MSKKNILLKKKNSTSWDELYPITIASNVKLNNGSNVETQLADKVSKSDVGTLVNLNTTDKTSLVNAVNEVFTSASNGKTSISNAISAKGVSASSSDTFSLLASKIGQIVTGKKFASGGNAHCDANGYLTITGLIFKPSIVFIYGIFFNGVYQTGYNTIYNANVPLYDTGNPPTKYDFILAQGSSLIPNKLADMSCSINNDGFKLKCGRTDTSMNYSWIAIE